jgi:hypothetical protein
MYLKLAVAKSTQPRIVWSPASASWPRQNFRGLQKLEPGSAATQVALWDLYTPGGLAWVTRESKADVWMGSEYSHSPWESQKKIGWTWWNHVKHCFLSTMACQRLFGVALAVWAGNFRSDLWTERIAQHLVGWLIIHYKHLWTINHRYQIYHDISTINPYIGIVHQLPNQPLHGTVRPPPGRHQHPTKRSGQCPTRRCTSIWFINDYDDISDISDIYDLWFINVYNGLFMAYSYWKVLPPKF